MNTDAVKKLVLALIVVLIAVPVLPRLIPKQKTFPDFIAGFEAAGLPVESQTPVDPPNFEAAEQISMYVGGVRADIMRYVDEGKIAKHVEYQKKDSGSAMVETFNLAQSLGAAPKRQTPYASARNGMFLIIVSGEDEALVKRVASVFRSR